MLAGVITSGPDTAAAEALAARVLSRLPCASPTDPPPSHPDRAPPSDKGTPMTTTAYDHWSDTYELFEGAMAEDTWRLGIGAELAKLAAPGPVRILDLGAGTGMGSRVLADLIPQGEVTSLDRSAAMLEHGGIPPELRIVGDMARFTAEPDSYDFVVSGFDALNYLTAADLAECLGNAAAALRPGGHLVFDYSSPQGPPGGLAEPGARGDPRRRPAAPHPPLGPRTGPQPLGALPLRRGGPALARDPCAVRRRPVHHGGAGPRRRPAHGPGP